MPTWMWAHSSSRRWAIDPPNDSYDLQRKNGMSHAELFSYAQDSRRWSVFRLGPEGHNILRFDGARQMASAHAKLGRIRETAGGASVAIDLAETYRGQAGNVRREVTLRPDRSVTIADAWLAGDTAIAVTWQWLTEAQVTREGDGLRLDQTGRTLRLRVTEPASARIEIQDVATLVKPPFDSPNRGYTRIVIHVVTPGNSSGRLEVHATPYRSE